MPDGENYKGHFDMATWAEGHEKLDDLRFKTLFSAVGVGLAILLGVCGWSLKANYDNADRVLQQFQGGYHGRSEPLQGTARFQPPGQ